METSTEIIRLTEGTQLLRRRGTSTACPSVFCYTDSPISRLVPTPSTQWASLVQTALPLVAFRRYAIHSVIVVDEKVSGMGTCCLLHLGCGVYERGRGNTPVLGREVVGEGGGEGGEDEEERCREHDEVDGYWKGAGGGGEKSVLVSRRRRLERME
jgi:hypothetical protein